MINKNIKSVLVLGGTGTIGSAVVDALCEEDIACYVVCRGKHRHIETSGSTYLYGDAFDGSFMDKILFANKYDAIVDLLWYSPEQFASAIDKLLHSTNHYICFSSCAVYAHSDGVITEDMPRFYDIEDEKALTNDGNWHYHLEKAEIENCIHNQKLKNWTIVRPHVTINENHLPLGIWGMDTWLYRLCKNIPIVIYNDIATKLSTYTTAHDVANMIAAILNNSEKTFSETYNVVSNLVLTGFDILTIAFNVLKERGYNPQLKIMPNCNSYYEYNPSGAERITYDRIGNRVFSNKKITKLLLSNQQFTSTKNQIATYIEKYIDNIASVKDCKNAGEMGLMDKLIGTNMSYRHLNSVKSRKNYLIARYPILHKIYNSTQPFFR